MAGDQALAAMVLKLANSAYYGYARKIESLPDAVVLLGFASVKNLAITASITRLLASDRDDSRPSAARSSTTRCAPPSVPAILGRARRVSGEKAFVAGLLHDLGLIVLVCYRQGALPPAGRARRRPGGRHRTRSRRRCSASRTPSSAPSWRRSGSSRRPSARRCATTTTRRRPSSIRGLALAVHAGDWLAKRLDVGFVPPRRPEWPHEPAKAEFELIGDDAPARLEAEIRAEFLEGESLRALAA